MKDLENDKIYKYLSDKGVDTFHTLGYNNYLDSFKAGSKFHITPTFLHKMSRDYYTFEDSLRENIIGQMNSKWEDLFKVVEKRVRFYKGKDPVFRCKNIRTGEFFNLIKGDFELRKYDTVGLLLYV